MIEAKLAAALSLAALVTAPTGAFVLSLLALFCSLLASYRANQAVRIVEQRTAEVIAGEERALREAADPDA